MYIEIEDSGKYETSTVLYRQPFDNLSINMPHSEQNIIQSPINRSGYYADIFV